MNLSNDVRESLSSEGKEKLKEMIGDPYDYQSEVVAEWDRVRMATESK